MPEPTLTPATISYGAAAWFAGKILGPSAEAMGKQLSSYLQSRCPVIFGRASEIAQQRGIEPQEIKPGLLARLIMDASFSDEDDDITDWWAHLMVDASLAGSNQHAVFSDMMALLGPREVRALQDFITSFPSCAGSAFGTHESWNNTLHSHFEGSVKAWLGESEYADRHDAIVVNFLYGDPSWPSRPTEWHLPNRVAGQDAQFFYGHDPRYVQNRMAFAILERVGILAPLDANFPVWGGNIWVRGVGLTNLGYEFYRACRGLRNETPVENTLE